MRNAGPKVYIEVRAMSAAALRRFTDRYDRTYVRPADVATRQAGEDAVRYLESQVKELKPKLEAAGTEADRIAGSLSVGAGAGPGLYKAAVAEADRLWRKLRLCVADLKKRKTERYMTTRDVHTHIIKPATDTLLCRYVEP